MAGGLIPTLWGPLPQSMVDLRAGSTVTDVSSNGVDDCEDWNNDYQRKIIEDYSFYYYGDSGDSEESHWENPEDVAHRERVDDYNFD